MNSFVMMVLSFFATAEQAERFGVPTPTQVASDNDPIAQNPADAVLEIQRRKCADCHGPDSDKRKAKRKYPDALDLAATVDEWVVPGDPMESDLYLMLEDGEMPPEDSDVKAMTSDELTIYRTWIEAGAPTAVTSAQAGSLNGEVAPDQEGGVNQEAGPDQHGGTEQSKIFDPFEDDEPKLNIPEVVGYERMRRFAARQHPAVVHFPIALILSAALLELLILMRRRESWLHAQRFCLRFGAMTAVVAVSLGFMLTEFTHVDDELWLHGGLAGAALLCTLTAARSVPKAVDSRRNRFRLWLGAAAVFICATGFMGGYLVFGWDYLKY
jgi:uncharacterized membrane protein